MIFGSIAYLPRGSDFSQPSGVCVCVLFVASQCWDIDGHSEVGVDTLGAVCF